MPGASYGVASLVVEFRPGTNRGSRVLILEGVNMEGTEAAVDFACDTDRPAELLQLKPAELATAGQNYRVEVLLRTKAMAGAARGTEVVTTRNTRAR